MSVVKVTKFGGSSLASAEQFKKVADIVLAEMPGDSGIGIALYNRLYKSAGGRVI